MPPFDTDDDWGTPAPDPPLRARIVFVVLIVVVLAVLILLGGHVNPPSGR